MPKRRDGNLRTEFAEERARQDEHHLRAILRQGGKRRVEIVRWVFEFQRAKIQMHGPGGALGSAELVSRHNIPDNAKSVPVGKSMRQQFDLLCGYFKLAIKHTGDVPAGLRKAAHVAAVDRIKVDSLKYDGNG